MEKIDWETLVERLIKWLWAVTAMEMAVGVGIRIGFAKSLPPQIPLFYSRPWGEEQLSGSWGLWWPLVIGVGVATLVTLVARKLDAEKVLAAILTASGTIVEIILLLAVLRIILLVT